MLRNPLATPFTLGVSAGASLGAMLVIVFGGVLTLGPVSTVPAASLVGAAAATAMVYWLATRHGHALSTSVLLLAGVTLNSFFSALILFLLDILVRRAPWGSRPTAHERRAPGESATPQRRRIPVS